MERFIARLLLLRAHAGHDRLRQHRSGHLRRERRWSRSSRWSACSASPSSPASCSRDSRGRGRRSRSATWRSSHRIAARPRSCSASSTRSGTRSWRWKRRCCWRGASAAVSVTDREFIPLKLERDRVVFFPLAWTIVHPIDETSPLQRLLARRPARARCRAAHPAQRLRRDLLADRAHALVVQSRRRSSGARSSGTCSTRSDPDGTISVDIRKLHESIARVREHAPTGLRCKHSPVTGVKNAMKQWIALAVVAPTLLLGAEKETCPFGPFDLRSPREQQASLYHQLSVTAEAVAPSGRRRAVEPVAGGGVLVSRLGQLHRQRDLRQDEDRRDRRRRRSPRTRSSSAASRSI